MKNKVTCTFCNGTGKIDAKPSARKLEQLAEKRKATERKNWYTSFDHEPSVPGIYQTAGINTFHLGSSYSYFDGDSWTKYRSWGDYHNANLFLWRGIGKKRDQPIQESI